MPLPILIICEILIIFDTIGWVENNAHWVWAIINSYQERWIQPNEILGNSYTRGNIAENYCLSKYVPLPLLSCSTDYVAEMLVFSNAMASDSFNCTYSINTVLCCPVLYVQVDRYKQVSSTAEKKLAGLELKNKELLASIAASPRCTYAHQYVHEYVHTHNHTYNKMFNFWKTMSEKSLHEEMILSNY